jgi:hypothetical protein
MLSSYDSVFGRETIEVCHKERDKEYDVYMVTGQSVEDVHEPPTDEIDYDKPRIPIHFRNNRGESFRWELVPLKYSLYTDATGRDHELDEIDCRLFIYKQPPFRNNPNGGVVRAHKYGIGVDSGTGQGYDASVISVTQCGDGPVPDVQVAEWRSTKVGHVEVFAFALPIALCFTNMSAGIDNVTPMDYPMVGIEQLLSVGDVCQKEMKRLGYPTSRFFNFGRYDGKGRLKQNTNKQGWFTTGWSRPILIDTFVYCVRNGWYKQNSPWTIEECRNFEIHHTSGGKERKEHSADYHDDGIFASAISTFILHDLDTLANRSKNQFRVQDKIKPALDLNPYNGYSYSGIERSMRKVETLKEILRG